MAYGRKQVKFEVAVAFDKRVVSEDFGARVTDVVGIEPTWDSRTSHHERGPESKETLEWKLRGVSVQQVRSMLKKLRAAFPGPEVQAYGTRIVVKPDFTIESTTSVDPA